MRGVVDCVVFHCTFARVMLSPSSLFINSFIASYVPARPRRPPVQDLLCLVWCRDVVTRLCCSSFLDLIFVSGRVNAES